jgi:Ca2+-binding EF-hand superfamily protein
MNFLSRYLFPEGSDSRELNEQLEYFRMLTDFSENELKRLKTLFATLTGGDGTMARETFIGLGTIARNPLKDRICEIFGFGDESNPCELTYEQFLVGLAKFNSPGRREEKMKIAFAIQDFDGDGLISAEDLYAYLVRITFQEGEGADTFTTEEDLRACVDEVFKEFPSVDRSLGLSLREFQYIVASTNFEIKLKIHI